MMQPWTPTTFVSATLAANPDPLNCYLVAEIITAIAKRRDAIVPGSDAAVLSHGSAASTSAVTVGLDSVVKTGFEISESLSSSVMTHTLSRAAQRKDFRESIQRRNPLRGTLCPTEKEKADALAIGGLRNTGATIAQLSYSADFG